MDQKNTEHFRRGIKPMELQYEDLYEQFNHQIHMVDEVRKVIDKMIELLSSKYEKLMKTNKKLHAMNTIDDFGSISTRLYEHQLLLRETLEILKDKY